MLFDLLASVFVNPTVDAISSTDASRTPLTQPNLRSRARLRLGPMPGTVSSALWIAVLGAHLAVVRDREAVRLVADALHEVEGLRRPRQDDRLGEVLHEQLFVLLGEAGQRHVLQPEVAHDVQRRR